MAQKEKVFFFFSFSSQRRREMVFLHLANVYGCILSSFSFTDRRRKRVGRGGSLSKFFMHGVAGVPAI